jgi:mediator of RNA polymerase II transcription subunit 21
MSSDVLTQLQTCYDQLLTQFFSTVSYLSQRHPLIAPDPDPTDPYTNPPSAIAGTQQQTPNPGDEAAPSSGILPGPEDTDRSVYPLRPAPPPVFADAQRELAEDLVLKGQQIELLISRLPGIGRGQEEQAEEIKILAQKVRDMEEKRKAKRKEMREYVGRLDEVIMGMSESIHHETLKNGTHQQSNGA